MSSLRRTAAPIPLALMASLLLPLRQPFPAVRGTRVAQALFGGFLRGALATHGAGACSDRLDDVVIPGAAAQVAVELVTDGLLVELVAVAANDVERRHDHAGRAEAALQPMVLTERLLHRMQLVALGERLDGRNLRSIERQG